MTSILAVMAALVAGITGISEDTFYTPCDKTVYVVTAQAETLGGDQLSFGEEYHVVAEGFSDSLYELEDGRCVSAEDVSDEQEVRLCEADGDVNEIVLSQINDELSLLPIDLLQEVFGNGWKMSLTDEEIGSIYRGITKPAEKEIKLHIYGSPGGVSLHEFAHAYCHEHPEVVNDMLHEAYEAEGTEGGVFYWEFSRHPQYSENEYYAEAFAQYVLHKDKLLSLCPKTYEYVDSCFREYFD